MKWINLIYVLSFIWIGISCKKEKEPNCKWANGNRTYTEVSGKIVTRGTDSYPGSGEATKLILQRQISSGVILGGGGYVSVDTMYSDNNGHFSVSFEAEDPCDRYRILASKKYPLHISPYITFLAGRTHILNLEYAPLAWVKLHVINQFPENRDQLYISWGGGESNSFFGPFNDTVIKERTGNIHYTIHSSFFRNNMKYDFKDSVYLKAFDTTYYLLNIRIQ
ncbi:hypothetical protein KZP23_04715 [Echinicola marina]|uniref:hypothetical protein n=1 Tax=Echinicola marina TaxID=2859768 RepID=UPI001CF6B12C|nr:hypothetical protein [Echinicola marina]UCS94336.1 hypothetical protein KZP23_04715 [Echinicola marina]